MLLSTTSHSATAGLPVFLLAVFHQPFAVLAAPQVGTAVPEAANTTVDAVDLVERSLSPHYSCYSSGEKLSDIGSSSRVDSTVKSACATFANYNDRKFVVGSTVSFCFPQTLSSPPQTTTIFAIPTD